MLNSPDPEEDYVTNELVATGLPPGEHEVVIRAHRGTDQWALNGFSAAYQPQFKGIVIAVIGLGIVTVLLFGAGIWVGRLADWGGLGLIVQQTYDSLDYRIQLGLTSIMALLVSFAGWTTWGEQAAGIYRRLGDGGQLALTAAAASTFYIAPSLILYGLAFIILFVLVYLRPTWGLAITVFSFPFYVKPKPMLGYQFSPVELFLFVTTTAIILRWLTVKIARKPTNRFINLDIKFISADYAVLFLALVATLSLIFTERLDVATNEWRVVIIEPIILYFLLRFMIVRDKEMWTLLDALILGAVVMSLIGLWQYATGQNLITSEGGLMRLRSIYGSPNNAALYLGRIIPILIAYVLMGNGRRRSLYGFGLILTTTALILTFSKGSLFLGLPLSLLVILIYWRRARGGALWPWLVGFFTLAAVILLVLFQIPQTAGRLNPQGVTGFLRLNLWKASYNMVRDHPVFGVGLDNFLYEYRGKYLLDAAWKEPNLSHPHNLILDLATRLGIFGLASGTWLFWSYWSVSHKLPNSSTLQWKPVAIGLVAVLFGLIAHGLVDHSLFLVDLSFVFFFLLGLGVWIKNFGNKAVTQPVVEG